MQKSKIYDTNPKKHVLIGVRHHMALKMYAISLERTSKDIIEEALNKMPGFKEFLK